MAGDDMTTINALMIATIALMLAGRGLPVIPISGLPMIPSSGLPMIAIDLSADLSGLTWQAFLTAAPCAEGDPSDCMLGP